ncbi:acyl-CoA dehydrogenase family protein [Bordetella hinzii]|uniref:acyl-CoA dehydrogenase family protein n=1 Tax=Bordetella hinzii TaxID=103855 RepID=UPI0039FCCC31
MSFQPKLLFPGLLSESASRLAQAEACPPVARIRELGWNAVLVAEAQGGAGGGFADLAAIVEGLAGQGVNLPVISRCGVVPALLAKLAGQPDVDRFLTDLASGAAVIELGSGLDDEALQGERDGQDWRLSGSTAAMSLDEDCSHVLLAARTGQGSLLAWAAARRLRDCARPYRSMDGRTLQVCELERFAVDGVLALGAPAAAAKEAGWRVGVAAGAADTVAAMGAALAQTIAYLAQREQFGQALAGFQALRHEVARLYIRYETAASLLQATLRSLDAADNTAFDLLGLYMGEQALPFAETVIQLHGGMGMTSEMPAARLATRLIANTLLHTDPLRHRRSLHGLLAGSPA